MQLTDGSIPVGARLARSHGDDNSFRRKVRVGAIGLLIVNLAVGLFARQQLHEIIDYATNIYDTAFISTNYIHQAEVSFQRYMDGRLSRAAPDEQSNPAEILDKVSDSLQVAIERSDSPHSRAMAQQLKAKIAAVASSDDNVADLKSRLTEIQHDFERLGAHASAVGLQARDDIEEVSGRSDTLLVVSIGTSIAMVAAALLLLERLITQTQLARREAERRDAELAAAAEQQSALREEELSAKSIQADRISELLDRFMRQMMEPTEQLHVAAKDLNTNAANLSEMAQEAKTQSVTVAAVSEQTVSMVRSAAQTGEELAQTIAEIQAHAIESSRLAAGAVSEVKQTNSTIDELALVAKEINEVTDLINRIAAQTNLLALNATIEAARAGDAGRGFAIVAQEVKALAAQTASATQDISEHVGAIQGATNRSVGAIQGISKTIRDLESFAARIAAAVEQQTQAAQQIAGSLSSTSANVINVNGAIANVGTVGNRTAEAAEILISASISVTDQAKKIHEQVRVFTQDIRMVHAQ